MPPRFSLLHNSPGGAAPLVVLAMTAAMGLGLPPAPAGAAEREPLGPLSGFSDLQPQDWAYQALIDLSQRYVCVAGVPGGAFAGQRSISRFEAAALLLACLDRIDAFTDEAQRLLSELEPELARLRARVDGLEARTLSLEARGFSTTTRLGGQVTFVVGGNAFGGSNTGLRQAFQSLEGGTTFTYDIHLDFDTSFSGKDLLRTRLRAGNFATSAFGNGVLPNEMEIAFEQDCGLPSDCGGVVAIDRLFYQFPLGSSLTATVGGRVRQDDMLGIIPSLYPAETILDVLTYAGAPGTYNSNLGAGGGLTFKSGNISLTAQYISANADAAVTSLQPGCNLASDISPECGGGIGNPTSAQTATLQLGYAEDQFGLALAYTTTSRFFGNVYGGDATELAALLALLENTNSFALSGYWQPASSGWIPSISAGWGINTGTGNALLPGLSGVQTQSWFVGLQWDDMLIRGNTLGMAVGQPTFVTRLPGRLTLPDGLRVGPGANDGSYVWEAWYRLQISDQISVTPAVFYLSAPLGQLQKGEGRSFTNLGALIKTSFRF
ncbi:iron uptake porin [Cyanobium sp. FGCU-52]|nr:iron uptake porin [Cyanobium sp. FGCU52]